MKTKPTPREIINSYSWDKIPPQATDVEKSVIGSFMLEADTYLMNPVSPEIFYKEEHKIICEAIQEMTRGGKLIDLITVTNYLRNKGKLDEVGGAFFITECTSCVSSANHVTDHIQIIKEKYFRREMIRMSHDLINGSYDESTSTQDVIESAQSIFTKVLSDEDNSVKCFDDIAYEICDIMAENLENKTNRGVLTGLKKFDEFSYGFQPSDLVLIAGETSHGKTTLAINIATNTALNGIPLAFYSLEMSAQQLTARIIASQTGIPSKKILYQKMFREELLHVESGISRIKGMPLYFDDKCSSSISKICASIRKMVIKYKIKEVFIDYLQLVNGDKSQGREEEVGQNARMLKNLAKELNIVIITLSQLRRSDDHVPTINRLRASGQIEEAADTVMLIWIPEIEGIEFLKKGDGKEVDMKGKADIIIAKGRNIGNTNFTVLCDREINKISNDEVLLIKQNNSFYESESTPF